MSAKDNTHVSQWFAELQGLEGSDLPPAELQRWERWIEEPDNRRAFDRYVKLWSDLGRLPRPTLEWQAADHYDGSVPVSEWLSRKRSPRRAVFHRWPVAATLAALMIAGSWFYLENYSMEDSQQFATAVQEHRQIRLSDGSTILLGADSVLTVRYGQERRSADLARGEALFEVRRDGKRPFVVSAGTATVRALGTAFNVLRGDGRVVVTVTQGLVEVKPAATAAPALVGKGKQVTYRAEDAKTFKSEIIDTDPVAAVSWPEGKLRYRSASLRSVIEDVNRYSRRRVILDPAVAELEFTGVMFHKEIDSWIDGLRLIFPVDLVNVDANTVLVRPRDSTIK